MTYVQLVPACRKLSGSQASPPFCSCKPGECRAEQKVKPRGGVSPSGKEQP